MRLMKAFLPLLLACALAPLSPAVSAEDSKDPKIEVIELKKKFAAMIARNDVEALTAALAPDWKSVGRDGAVTNRDEVVAFLKSGRIKFTSYEVSELEVRVFGDSAVLIGIGEGKAEADGQSVEGKDRFTDVFIRRDGKWQCVSSHASALTRP